MTPWRRQRQQRTNAGRHSTEQHTTAECRVLVNLHTPACTHCAAHAASRAEAAPPVLHGRSRVTPSRVQQGRKLGDVTPRTLCSSSFSWCLLRMCFTTKRFSRKYLLLKVLPHLREGVHRQAHARCASTHQSAQNTGTHNTRWQYVRCHAGAEQLGPSVCMQDKSNAGCSRTMQDTTYTTSTTSVTTMQQGVSARGCCWEVP